LKNQNRYNCLIKLNSNSKIGASSSRSPDLIAAEIRPYDAQSAAISLNANLDAKRAEADVKRAEADVKRAEAESSAIRSREFTDAKRAEAESSAIILNANADAKRAEAEASAIRSRTIALFFFPCAIVAGFALDFYLHESPGYIKRRMLKTLLKCNLPATLAPMPLHRLKITQKPLFLGFLPTLVLGPSGCGKSTLLSGIMTSLQKPAPVVLVRMRLPSTKTHAKAGLTDIEPHILMKNTAKQVFSQIGFPMRRSLIGFVFSRGIVFGERKKQADISAFETIDRLVTALCMLFEVCEELKLERQKTMDPLDAAPILLFDEVQDLIKDSRLNQAGGKIVLEMLGALLVGYCVDRRAIRAAVAGSSAELYFAFADNTPLRGPRLNYFDLEDPVKSTVISALINRGYSKEEAIRMTDLCGTRLRLLEGPLTAGKEQYASADFLKNSRSNGDAAFASIFSKLNSSDTLQLCEILDKIEISDALMENDDVGTHCDIDDVTKKHSSDFMKTNDSFDREFERNRPRKEMLPKSLLEVDVSPILFVDRNRKLFFQSRLHRCSWLYVRKFYSEAEKK
jgi:energy-coupling factor transporter ATP-binding protein EcfA2